MMEYAIAVACASGGLCAGLGVGRFLRSRRHIALRRDIRERGSFDAFAWNRSGEENGRGGYSADANRMAAGMAAKRYCCDGVAARVLAYTVELERRLNFKSTQPLSTRIPVLGRRAEGFLAKHARKAGLENRIGPVALTEARLRLTGILAVAGAVFGSVFSNELLLIGIIAGAALGWRAPGWAVEREAAARLSLLDGELPEMLEVVSLALRSGMAFDQGFSLYHMHFSSPFARECASAQHHWELGLLSREDALRGLAAGYDSPLLERVVDHIIRSLRFGTAMAESLEANAVEARAVRRTRREEQVAKAPVKMMIPTGTLILPAMLILVLGPVLLELMAGF